MIRVSPPLFWLLLLPACGSPGHPSAARRVPASLEDLELVVSRRQSVKDLAVSRDGGWLLCATYDTSVALWDLRAGLEVRRYDGHHDELYAVAFAPDERMFASASLDGTVRTWDVATGEQLRVLELSDWATSVVFSPDGERLVTGDYAGVTTIWNLRTGEQEHVLDALPLGVENLEFRNNGRELHACAYNGDGDSYRVAWSTSSWERVRGMEANSDLMLSLDPTGKRTVSLLRGKYELLDAVTWENPIELERPDGYTIEHFEFHPNGELLAASAYDRRSVNKAWGGAVYVYDARTGEHIQTLHGSGQEGPNLAFAFVGDGSRIVTADLKAVYLWSVESGQLLRRLEPRGHWVRSVAVHPHGHTVVLGMDDQIRLWDLTGAEQPRTRRAHGEGTFDGILDLAISPDGLYLVSGGMDGNAYLWDEFNDGPMRRVHLGSSITAVRFTQDPHHVLLKESGTEVVRAPLHLDVGTKQAVSLPDGGWGLAVTPDGSLVLASGKETVYRVDFDAESYEALYTLPEGTSSEALTVTSDGSLAACGGRQGGDYEPYLAVFDPREKALLHELKGHRSGIADLAFAPSGELLASCSLDGDVILWDARAGTELARLTDHGAQLSKLAWSADGTRLLSCGKDGSSILWQIDTHEQLARLVPVADEDWAIVLPDNSYWSSRGALDSMAFRSGLAVFPFEQFDLIYHRPDLVLEALGHASTERIEAYAAAREKRLEKMDLGGITSLGTATVPVVELVDAGRLPMETAKRSLTLQVEAQGGPLDRMNVWVDGVPIHGRRGIPLAGAPRAQRSLEIELAPGSNRIEVSALSTAGIESIRATHEVVCTDTTTEPELFVVAVGVSRYQQSGYDLQYAAKDASDLAQAFEANPGPFARVHTHMIRDDRATRDEILTARAHLERARVEDAAVVFYAGHGVLEHDLEYVLATHDMDFSNPGERGLSYELFEGLLDGLDARRKLVLIDACHSGEVDAATYRAEGDWNTPAGQVSQRGIQVVENPTPSTSANLLSSFELMQQLFVDLRRGTGATIISSAGGAEFALESDQWRNGVFTYSVLEGLSSGQADLNRDGSIYVSELREHVQRQVLNLTQGRQRPTSRSENLGLDFQVR